MFLARNSLTDNTSWVKPEAILDLDFVNGRYFWKGRLRSISGLTYSGGANSTFVDSGKRLRATDGTPRRTYDIATGAPLGLVTEGAVSNLALYSDDFTQALTWIAVNMTTAMTATGPDGVANSATTLTATAANATILQSIVAASGSRISSVYIKRRTGSGTINVTQDNGTTWTVVTITSEWTRVSIPVATLANPIIGIRIVTDTDAVDVFGFQHEPTITDQASVTSLARTTTVAVAKTADVLTLSSSLFGLTGHPGITMYAEYAPLSRFCVPSELQNLSAGGVESFFMQGNNTNVHFNVRVASSAVVGTAGASGPAIGVFAKVAGAVELNNARHAVNGTLQGADDTACTVPVPDTLYVGTLRGGGVGGSLLKRLTIWSRRLPNETLAAMTA